MPIAHGRAGASPIVGTCALAFGLACGPLQTYSQGVQAICDAAADCTDCDDPRPAERAYQVESFISSTAWNQKAIATYHKPIDSRRANPTAARAEALAKAASEAGVSPCQLADDLAREGRLVEEAVQPALPALEQCGAPSDDVRLTFEISAGAATGTLVFDGEIDDATRSCIADQFKKLRFDPSLTAVARWRFGPEGR